MITGVRKLTKTTFPRGKADVVVRKPQFSVKIYRNAVGYNRFSVIISGKAMPRAVDRHFWKRFFLDAVVDAPDNGRDYVFFIGTVLNKKTAQQYKNYIHEIFS